MDELLATVLEAARKLTALRLGVSAYGYTGTEFRLAATSLAEGPAPGPGDDILKVEKGGVYLDVLQRGPSLRLSEVELPRHPAWWVCRKVTCGFADCWVRGWWTPRASQTDWSWSATKMAAATSPRTMSALEATGVDHRWPSAISRPASPPRRPTRPRAGSWPT